MSIEIETVPDTIAIKSQDFLASDAVKCAPLGGINEYSVDNTVVLNLPDGPDGNTMVPMWIEPRKIPYYKEFGIQPVTVSQKKAYKLGFTSASVQDGVDGLVYRDAKSVVLAWTTRSRYAEIEQQNTEVNAKAMGAKTKMHEEALAREDAYGLQHGIPHFTVDEFRGSGDVDIAPDFIAMPGRAKTPKVSMAGPKKDGTKVWKDKED